MGCRASKSLSAVGFLTEESQSSVESQRLHLFPGFAAEGTANAPFFLQMESFNAIFRSRSKSGPPKSTHTNILDVNNGSNVVAKVITVIWSLLAPFLHI